MKLLFLLTKVVTILVGQIFNCVSSRGKKYNLAAKQFQCNSYLGINFWTQIKVVDTLVFQACTAENVSLS